MNIIFNELSFMPLTENEYLLREKFLGLINTFDFANLKFGFKHIVFPSNIGSIRVTPDKTFYQWVYAITHQGEKNKILSIVKRPFGDEILAEQKDELSKYYYQNSEHEIPETYCNGLAVAHVRKELCSSITLHSIWDVTEISFRKIISDDLETENVTVPNVTQEKHFGVEGIRKFVEYLGELDLDETDVNPKDKPIALRDDHGKDKLLAFSKKLVKSKYVLAVINSLPYNPKSVNLIKDTYSDGKIEMVLYWEDKGIGIIIQSTGRNYRETEEIAKRLRKEFDR